MEPSNQQAAVGVDLGGTHARAAVVTAEGRILTQARARVADDRRPEAVVARIVEVVQEALAQAGLGLEETHGLGVGVAGQVRGASGVVANGPNLGWREVPLADLLEQALGTRPRVVNDLDAIAWGEVRHGAAKGHEEVLVVYAGTGVGGAFVIAGQPHHGANGVAGEIGHVKVRGPEGAACGCGGRGCLEAYLGGKNLSEGLRREALTWPDLMEAAGGQLDGLHPGVVEALFVRGDARALAMWRELGEMFGDVLAHAVTLCNPSLLVLGGTVAEGCPELMRLTRERLSQRASSVSLEALSVVAAQLGDDAGVVGAASLGRMVFESKDGGS